MLTRSKINYNNNNNKINNITLLNRKRHLNRNKNLFKILKNEKNYLLNNNRIGIKNLGNTCFINSIFQSFLNIKKQFIFEICNNKNCFFCEIQNLFYNILMNPNNNKYIIPTSEFLTKITDIMPFYKKGRQEDAHEFFVYFLSKIQDFSPHPNSFLASLPLLFTGSLISQVKCGKCQFISSSFEKFTDISLDILNVNNLQSSIDDFCHEEILEGDNKYYCEKCRKKTISFKRVFFDKFPKIFVFHLKRADKFQHKIKKYINFNLILNFKNYNIKNKNQIYNLNSVIIHEGYSINSGHYLTYCKIKNGNWISYDDIRVEKIKENEILSSTPYMLFYEKVDK